ncbi:hypothetical protein B0H19DRAFT_435313 [Mycena capillaripes]|nr:hypothetical protein B0H19DRAFT_435313 [Mycena capillaripes]
MCVSRHNARVIASHAAYPTCYTLSQILPPGFQAPSSAFRRPSPRRSISLRSLAVTTSLSGTAVLLCWLLHRAVLAASGPDSRRCVKPVVPRAPFPFRSNYNRPMPVYPHLIQRPVRRGAVRASDMHVPVGPALFDTAGAPCTPLSPADPPASRRSPVCPALYFQPSSAFNRPMPIGPPSCGPTARPAPLLPADPTASCSVWLRRFVSYWAHATAIDGMPHYIARFSPCFEISALVIPSRHFSLLAAIL